jgi:hypothetical protein
MHRFAATSIWRYGLPVAAAITALGLIAPPPAFASEGTQLKEPPVTGVIDLTDGVVAVTFFYSCPAGQGSIGDFDFEDRDRLTQQVQGDDLVVEASSLEAPGCTGQTETATEYFLVGNNGFRPGRAHVAIDKYYGGDPPAEPGLTAFRYVGPVILRPGDI